VLAVGRFDAALTLFSVGLALSTAVLFPLAHLTLLWRSTLPLLGIVAGFLAFILFYKWRREPRLVDVLRSALWTLVLSNLCILPLYLPMRHGAPLADAWLGRLDHAVFFDDASLVLWTRAHPLVDRASSVVYDTLTLLCLVSVMVTSFLRRVALAETLLLAIVVGVVATVVVAYVVPAIGPWELGGFAPRADQVSCGSIIRQLRGDSVVTVDLANPDPIIATPSWHVILAVLAALALRPVRWVGGPACVWAGLIVLSTLTTGWHYLADVICGLVVAVGAHVVAARWAYPWVVGRA
jgi:hypothetical protein